MNPMDIIVACDFPTAAETLAFLDRFSEKKPYVKVGMELFYAEGPSVIHAIKERGHQIFLDLKLHDIPNTVYRAMKNLAGLEVDMLNLHAAGGIAMMTAAREGLLAGAGGRCPQLIAVTVLTSIDQRILEEELLNGNKLEDLAVSYARSALKAGVDGVVCSPLEAESIHRVLGQQFLTVTPGIRWQENELEDQKRVATPKTAREHSNYIVMGRPITTARDPVEAYALACREYLGSV